MRAQYGPIMWSTARGSAEVEKDEVDDTDSASGSECPVTALLAACDGADAMVHCILGGACAAAQEAVLGEEVMKVLRAASARHDAEKSTNGDDGGGHGRDESHDAVTMLGARLNVLADGPLRDKLVHDLHVYGDAMTALSSTGTRDAQATAAADVVRLGPLATAFQALATHVRDVAGLLRLWHEAAGDAELQDAILGDLCAAQRGLFETHTKAVGALVEDGSDAGRGAGGGDSHPEGALMELHAGAGGDEAALFTGELLGMYGAFVAQVGKGRGWQGRVSKCARADGGERGGGGSATSGNDGSGGGDLPALGDVPSAPVRAAALHVWGPGAYALLRGEAGVHRVQRIPKTESQGRVHTSTVSIAVFPAQHPRRSPSGAPGRGGRRRAPDVPPVDPREVRVDVYRASGPGGQHVNKTESAVRLTHLPTGIVVTSQNDRSQLRNKATAMKVLAGRIHAKRGSAVQKQRAQEKSAMVGSGGRSDRIRTYNWAQDRVTDHRLGSKEGTVFGLASVLAGRDGLVRLVTSLQAMRRRERLEAFVRGLPTA